MRQKHNIQPKLQGALPGHQLAAEMRVMAQILEKHGCICDAVLQDLTKSADDNTGAPGMDAMSVIKAALLQKLMGVSYERLAFHLIDSRCCRDFMRLGPFDQAPGKSALQDNIKKISFKTWEGINQVLMDWAKEKGIENGGKMRFDSTFIEANIHHPTDSSLLNDLVRVICRSLKKSSLPGSYCFRDRRRVARKLAFKISYAKNAKHRKSLYRKLIRHCQDLYNEVLQIVMRLGIRQPLAERLTHHLDLMQMVIEQTRQRVILGKNLPPEQKVVSIFETHADILKKERRETVFGHKICLAGGASGLITDCTIEYGNPPDSHLAPKMIARQKGIFKKLPRQAAFDGGFASKSNLRAIKAYGVRDCAFHKKRGIEICDMVKSSWVYKQLKNFRAGIEGCISYLKRAFAMDRCNWRGRQSFDAYVWTSILAHNLLVLARHCMEKNLL